MLESMNYVCDEEMWNRVLNFNFSTFVNNFKKHLEDDLEIFLHLKFRFYLFVFFNLSLYSVFHIFVLAKELATRKNLVKVIVHSVFEFLHNFLIIIILFKTLLLRNEIILLSLINFFEELHFFLSTFAMIMQKCRLKKS